jgi:hypothetical protein
MQPPINNHVIAVLPDLMGAKDAFAYAFFTLEKARWVTARFRSLQSWQFEDNRCRFDVIEDTGAIKMRIGGTGGIERTIQRHNGKWNIDDPDLLGYIDDALAEIRRITIASSPSSSVPPSPPPSLMA